MISEKKLDDAVSPVIGIMLMLVVTLIIAAVIGVFASGVTDTTSSVPSAVIKIQDYGYENQYGGATITSVTFRHMSGDSIDLNDLAIETEWDYALNFHTDIANNEEWKLNDVNEDGLWNSGEYLIYTFNENNGRYSAGFAAYSILITGAEIVDVRVATASGKTICDLELQVR